MNDWEVTDWTPEMNPPQVTVVLSYTGTVAPSSSGALPDPYALARELKRLAAQIELGSMEQGGE